MTRAIAALIDIMQSEDAPLRRRIEATEGLLGYETPGPGVELAIEFLTSVFENHDEDFDSRLDALKLVRKFEARKISKPTVAPADDPAIREAWRRLETAQRRMVLIEAGLWPPEPGWDSDLRAPAYKPPHGAGDITNPTNLAKRMKRARALEKPD